MKIVPAFFIIYKALIKKKNNKKTIILESSSGNFAYGLSLVCNYYKLKLIIVGDKNIDKKLQKKMVSLGTKLVLVNSLKNKNIQTLRLNKLKILINKYKNNHFWPKQYDNPDNYKSYSILEKFMNNKLKLSKFDFLVCPVGSGGNSAGFYKLIKKFNKKIKLVGVDSVNSVIFGKKNGIRNLRGPGSSIYPKNIIYKYFSKVFWVTDVDAFTNAFNLYRINQFQSSPCVGAVDLVSKEIQKLYPKKKILSVFPETSERYLTTVFNLKWLKKNRLINLKKTIKAKKLNKIEPNFKKFCFIEWKNKKFRK